MPALLVRLLRAGSRQADLKVAATRRHGESKQERRAKSSALRNAWGRAEARTYASGKRHRFESQSRGEGRPNVGTFQRANVRTIFPCKPAALHLRYSQGT